MAEADKHGLRAALVQEFLSASVQNNERLTTFLPSDLHILPAKLSADARAEGFRNGFLGSKPCGQKWRGISVGKTIVNFVWEKNATEEPLPKLLMGSMDAGDFDDIDADAEDHGRVLRAER